MQKALNRPRRVLMLATNHRPGDVRIFRREAVSLARDGYQVAFLTPAERYADYEELGVTVHTVPAGGGKGSSIVNYLQIIWRVLMRAWRLEADIVHCHEPESLLIGVLLKWFKGVHLVYDAHDHYPSLYLERGRTRKGRALAWLTELAERFGVWQAERVITVNVSLMERFKNRKPVTILMNVPDRSLFRVNRVDPELEARYAGKHVILHHGYMFEGRGLRVLLEAFAQVHKQLPATHLLMIGRVDGEVPAHLAEGVEILPAVSYEKIVPYVNLAYMGVIVFRGTDYNHTIGLPNKLFEYMACGKPVVASNLPEIARVVGGNEAGLLVAPEKADEVSAAMLQLLHDPEYARACGQRGLAAVKREYCWEQMEERLLALYAGLDR